MYRAVYRAVYSEWTARRLNILYSEPEPGVISNPRAASWKRRWGWLLILDIQWPVQNYSMGKTADPPPANGTEQAAKLLDNNPSGQVSPSGEKKVRRARTDMFYNERFRLQREGPSSPQLSERIMEQRKRRTPREVKREKMVKFRPEQ